MKWPKDKHYKFHRWFAWYPVTVWNTLLESKQTIWLNYVYRRYEHRGLGVWSYRYKYPGY